MKQYRIEITDLAAEDLENAGDYIAYQLINPLAAVNTVEGIRKQINSLGDFPERKELDEDEKLAELGIRNEYYKNYKIYYVVKNDVIYVSKNTAYACRQQNMVVPYVWIIRVEVAHRENGGLFCY